MKSSCAACRHRRSLKSETQWTTTAPARRRDVRFGPISSMNCMLVALLAACHSDGLVAKPPRVGRAAMQGGSGVGSTVAHEVARGLARAGQGRFALAAPVVVDDGLASAQCAAPDSVSYLLSPSSRFEVRTGTAGVFGFAGHRHVVGARAFSGSVIYRPGNPSASRLDITIPTESLAVLTPNDTAEIRQVTKAMRADVLHVDTYPEIRFVVTRATQTTTGARLDGELTLVGRTRPVQVDASVQVGPDTLRARGKFAVKQTDFGMKPYHGGPGGTVQVADQVTFDFDAIGVREGSATVSPGCGDDLSLTSRAGRRSAATADRALAENH
jgi:polyisoprenoid-binding protein YceI